MNGKSPNRLYLGTSSWTADGWEKSFYSPKMKKADYLAYYATQYSRVECDATFYAIPSARTVEGWERKITNGFLFSAKVP